MTGTIHLCRLRALAGISRLPRFFCRDTGRRSSLRSFLAMTTLAFAATGSTAHAVEARYECNRGTVLTAKFSPPGAGLGQVVLIFEGSQRQIILPQVMSADGGRYAKGKTEFWIKGQDATLTRNGERETCTVR